MKGRRGREDVAGGAAGFLGRLVEEGAKYASGFSALGARGAADLGGGGPDVGWAHVPKERGHLVGRA